VKVVRKQENLFRKSQNEPPRQQKQNRNRDTKTVGYYKKGGLKGGGDVDGIACWSKRPQIMTYESVMMISPLDGPQSPVLGST